MDNVYYFESVGTYLPVTTDNKLHDNDAKINVCETSDFNDAVAGVSSLLRRDAGLLGSF
jgi:hypothetical protein